MFRFRNETLSDSDFLIIYAIICHHDISYHQDHIGSIVREPFH